VHPWLIPFLSSYAKPHMAAGTRAVLSYICMNRLFLLLAPAFLFVSAQAQELPAGKGKDVVEKICGACHGTDIIAAMKNSRDGWTDTVEDMISKGATASATEKTQILDYLATYLGDAKINVNKATSAELAKGLDISAKDADAIVKYKQDNGDYKTWADLAKVPGIDQKKLEAKKDSVTF
jgi:competence protein ComEA